MSRLTVIHARGGRYESEHPVSAVVVDASGRVRERVGDPVVTTWRSAAKPFQLEVSLGLLPERAVAELDPRDVAIGAASHWGEPGHVERVEGVLKRFGCTEGDLFCGAHWPGTEEAHHALVREGRPCTALHNNCSGKHSFMAASCREHGWDRDYRAPEHPLQQRIRSNVDQRSGGTCDGVVIDGCGVPCFVLPIDGMARAWAQVAADMPAGETPLGRIGRAMHAGWWFVSGTGAVDGTIMRDATRPIVAKVGAVGLMCLAIPSEGVGVAVKVHTGSEEARAIAVGAVLDRFFPGLVPEATFEGWRVVKNWVGTVCGERVAKWA